MTARKSELIRLARMMPGLWLLLLALVPAMLPLLGGPAGALLLLVPVLGGVYVLLGHSVWSALLASLGAWVMMAAVLAGYVLLAQAQITDVALYVGPGIWIIWMVSFGTWALVAESHGRLPLFLLWVTVVPATYLSGLAVSEISSRLGNAGMDVLVLFLLPVAVGSYSLGLRVAIAIASRIGGRSSGTGVVAS